MIWLLLCLDDSLVLHDGRPFTNARTVSVQVLPARDGWEITLGPALDSPAAWRRLAPGLSYDLGEGDAEKTVFAWLRDPGGRQSGPLRASIVLDTQPPRPKASAPERARPGKIVLVSDVPDAVAMRIGEGAWVPYATPTEADAGALVVRYRDPAGNVSEPLELAVEVADDAPLIEAANELRALRVAPLKGGRPGILLSLEAVGMREMRIEGGPREPFVAGRVLGGEARRIRVSLWDQQDQEHVAELAFQEEDLARLEPEPDPDRPYFFATLRGGAIFDTLSFDALTTVGPRELKAGTLGIARIELGAALSDAFYAAVAVEAGLGDEVRTITGEAALGCRVIAGDIELRAQVGALGSKVDVDVSGFGDFDPAFGVRAALDAGFHLSDTLRLSLGVEFRHLSYDWSDEVISGDREASGQGVGLTFGLSLDF